MIKIDLSNILNKALGISKEIKFKVYSYNDKNGFMELDFKELTYLQLGTILMTSHKDIKEIHIVYKE